jgi:hypothetical protein
VAALLLVWGLWAALAGRAAPPVPPPGASGGDFRLYQAVTNRVAAGEDYYRVLAQELPARGYAIRPIFNWRLPTVVWLNASLPSPLWSRGLLVGIGLATIPFWLVAMKTRTPRAILPALGLLAIGNMVLTVDSARHFHEVWSGAAIAASLALHANGRTVPALFAGGAAMAIRELAAPYVVVMAVVAWRERRRREFLGWIGVVTLGVAYWSWHAMQVLDVLPAEGLTNSWVRAGGWPFALMTAQTHALLLMAPQWIAAVVLPLVWVGAMSWRDGVGHRLAAILSVYLACFMVFGRPDNWYWGFQISLLFPVAACGLLFRAPQPAGTAAAPEAR